MTIHWDKQLAYQLRQEKLTEKQIGFVIGIVAEHRQIADHDGYKRGYIQAVEKFKQDKENGK